MLNHIKYMKEHITRQDRLQRAEAWLLWSLNRGARDYCDLWRILRAYQDDLDLSDFRTFLKRKCEARGVGFSGPDDFFQDPMISYVKNTWEQWLGPLVPDLPPFETVFGELRLQN